MTQRSGSIALEFPRGRALRLALAGGTLGFFGFAFWLVLALVRASGAGEGLAIVLFAITTPAALAISIALPPWLLMRRAPYEARLSWDRDGIVEREGDTIRTSIRWDVARARIETGPQGRIVQITDGARAITVADFAACPPWLARRRASTSSLDELIASLRDRETGPPIAPDDRDARRPVGARAPILLTLAIAALAVPVLALALPPLAAPFVALIAMILCAIPTLRPLHELAALIGESRAFDRAEDATLEELDRERPIVRIRGTLLVRLDLTHARHPDALLGERRDAALRIVLPASGWLAAPSRAALGAASIAPEAIETMYETAARERLARTVLIELGARGAAVVFWAAMSLSPLWL